MRTWWSRRRTFRNARSAHESKNVTPLRSISLGCPSSPANHASSSGKLKMSSSPRTASRPFTDENSTTTPAISSVGASPGCMPPPQNCPRRLSWIHAMRAEVKDAKRWQPLLWPVIAYAAQLADDAFSGRIVGGPGGDELDENLDLELCPQAIFQLFSQNGVVGRGRLRLDLHDHLVAIASSLDDDEPIGPNARVLAHDT